MTQAADPHQLRRDHWIARVVALASQIKAWCQSQAWQVEEDHKTIGDVRRCLDHIEMTYIMRLFGAFEAVLRDYWMNGIGRVTEPDLVQLLSSLHGRQNMDDTTLDAVNEIRRWRNQVIHRDVRAM